MHTENDQKLVAALKKLPLDYWDFRDDDTKEYTHGIHNYPAMMVCPISRNIIRLVREIQPIHALLDPFAGSGTVLVEGMVNGIEKVAGNDINPLALLLSKVKTTPIAYEKLSTEITGLLKRIESIRGRNSDALDGVDSYIADVLQLDLTGKKGWGNEAHTFLRQYCDSKSINITIPEFKNMGYWFRPRVVLELAIIKAEIEQIKNKDIRDFVFVAMSETIRFVSNRRNGEFKMFRMPPAKVQEFNPDVYDEFSRILWRNASKMKDFCETLSNTSVKSVVSVFNN